MKTFQNTKERKSKLHVPIVEKILCFVRNDNEDLMNDAQSNIITLRCALQHATKA